MSKIIFINLPKKAREVDEWWVRQNYGSPVLKELTEKGEYNITSNGWIKLKLEK